MRNPDGATVALVGLVAVQGVNLLRDLAPPLADIRAADVATDTNIAADTRAAEVVGAAVIVLLGSSVSAISGAQSPFWLSLATAGLIVGLYEWTLRGRRFE